MNDREHWREAEWTVTKRAAYTLGLMVARGTTRVRSYAQVDVDCGLERFEAVMAARDEHADRCSVEVIAFPQAGLLREPGTVPLLESALQAGADMIGGIDPCQLDRDPVRHLDVVFGLAEKYQVPVDIHLHEPGELGVFSADLVLERVRALSMQGRVTISHGYALGGVSEATTRRLVEEFAELDVSMATVAPSVDTALPLVDLTEAGVRVGLGEDGQRDYWSPYGNADMLDRTWQRRSPTSTGATTWSSTASRSRRWAGLPCSTRRRPGCGRWPTGPELRSATSPSCWWLKANRWPPRSWTAPTTEP